VFTEPLSRNALSKSVTIYSGYFRIEYAGEYLHVREKYEVNEENWTVRQRFLSYGI
jgi:hypothetical protein